MPTTSETSTTTSTNSTEKRRRWKLARAFRKADFNERVFTDNQEREIKNWWHHREWFAAIELYDWLAILAAREHAKTEIFAKADPLFEIGVDANIRVLIVSAVFEQSVQRTRVLREHIERNEAYRAEFPHVRIVHKKGDEQFTVARDRILKEPTVLSTYAGGPIPGYRFDRIILDDVVNYLLNSSTRAKREKLLRWLYDEVINSLAEGGKLVSIGTLQHSEDLHHTLRDDERFVTLTYPAVDDEADGYGDRGYREKNEREGIDPKSRNAVCLWPGMHDAAKLAEKKEANEESYLRQQQQIAVPESGLVYRRPLIDAALERGKRVRPVASPDVAQFLALDPGYGKRAALLAIQERSGDRVEVWGEYSFTMRDDDDISKVAVEHCRDWTVQAIYVDAEDPGLAGAIARDLDNAGLTTAIVRVPFNQFKRAAIKTTRWMLQAGRLSLKAEKTTVYRPGKVKVEDSILRREIRDYALKPDTDDEPVKDNDHGPDALTAYMSKWVDAWLEATEQTNEEKPVDRAIAELR